MTVNFWKEGTLVTISKMYKYQWVLLPFKISLFSHKFDFYGEQWEAAHSKNYYYNQSLS